MAAEVAPDERVAYPSRDRQGAVRAACCRARLGLTASAQALSGERSGSLDGAEGKATHQIALDELRKIEHITRPIPHHVALYERLLPILIRAAQHQAELREMLAALEI